LIKQVTGFPEKELLHHLSVLKDSELIYEKGVYPQTTYTFKHALTQEAIYNTILKRDRRLLHERIGIAMEELYRDRLSEFYESLSFHFKQGTSFQKAIDYLIKSGEKSLNRYSVEESHQYFKEAFELLVNKPNKGEAEQRLLVNILTKWSSVFYYRGDFKGMEKILLVHLSTAENWGDKADLGMLYGWLGFVLFLQENFEDSYRYLLKGLRIGEAISNDSVVGYTCGWLTWTCGELGFLEEGMAFGERGREIAKIFASDAYLYFNAVAGLGILHFWQGNAQKAIEMGEVLVEYGERHLDPRTLIWGYFCAGLGYFLKGDLPSSHRNLTEGIRVSKDPYYVQLPKMILGCISIYMGLFEKAEEHLNEVITYAREFGILYFETLASSYLGIALIARGQMAEGFHRIEAGVKKCDISLRKNSYAHLQVVLGIVYLQLIERAVPFKLFTVLKNIGFLIKRVPFASKKAEVHLRKAIEVAGEIGARHTQGMAELHLGLLYKAKRKRNEARRHLTEALRLFEQCKAEIYLKQTKDILTMLEELSVVRRHQAYSG
jgi:tetratricopeptide (TPR) repeat protein